MKYIFTLTFLIVSHLFISPETYVQGCQPTRYKGEFYTAEQDTIVGYVYDCYLKPRTKFSPGMDFLDWFLKKYSNPILRIYTIVKQIKPLPGLDISLGQGVKTFKKDEIIGSRILEAKGMNAATSTIHVNQKQYVALTDSTKLARFYNPADVGGFCESLLISLNQYKSQKTLDSLAEKTSDNIQAYLNEDSKNGYSPRINDKMNAIEEELLEQDVLYYEICGP